MSMLTGKLHDPLFASEGCNTGFVLSYSPNDYCITTNHTLHTTSQFILGNKLRAKFI
jgi:hypothetical protein